jgi:hypothetical protein
VLNPLPPEKFLPRISERRCLFSAYMIMGDPGGGAYRRASLFIPWVIGPTGRAGSNTPARADGTVCSRRSRLQIIPDAGAPLDFVEEVKRFTVDVTTLVTFGHDLNTVEQGDDVIQRKLELVFPAFNRRLFALFPVWRLVRLPRDRRLDRALVELRAWLGELVVAERARLAAEPGRDGAAGRADRAQGDRR